jgi:hypothetical protein
MTKPVVVATAAPDCGQIGVGQHVMTHQFALLCRRIE